MSDEKSKKLAETKPSRWLQPFDDMDDWFDELQKHWLSQRFFGRGMTDYANAFGGRVPKVDVIDRKEEICVRAELPGVRKEDIQVTLNDNILAIHAKVEKEEEKEEDKYHRRELLKGEFQRTLQLPAPVDEKNTKATFKDGVLELCLPKLAEFTPKTITVE
ncbi:MAG: Hsp20/alpha crystallin family protein [Methylococcus sp.]|jgi:HSP20 family protein